MRILQVVGQPCTINLSVRSFCFKPGSILLLLKCLARNGLCFGDCAPDNDN